ncbi:hypothetical protein SFRURICE_007265 [Spodoptera frugiperda]|nr:hypothetical protein SFRURICE_007265 [Spodoptera frugiperda]
MELLFNSVHCTVTLLKLLMGPAFPTDYSEKKWPKQTQRSQSLSKCKHGYKAVCRPGITKTTSRSSVSGSSAAGSPTEERAPPVGAPGPPSVPPPAPLASAASIDRPLPPIPAEPSQPPPPPLTRRDSQASQASTVSSASAAPSTTSSTAPTAAPPSAGSTPARGGFARQGSLSAALTEDAEDTMKNLRKTFAGIFGDM